MLSLYVLQSSFFIKWNLMYFTCHRLKIDFSIFLSSLFFFSSENGMGRGWIGSIFCSFVRSFICKHNETYFCCFRRLLINIPVEDWYITKPITFLYPLWQTLSGFEICFVRFFAIWLKNFFFTFTIHFIPLKQLQLFNIQ